MHWIIALVLSWIIWSILGLSYNCDDITELNENSRYKNFQEQWRLESELGIARGHYGKILPRPVSSQSDCAIRKNECLPYNNNNNVYHTKYQKYQKYEYKKYDYQIPLRRSSNDESSSSG
jgi:hypothetical protein